VSSLPPPPSAASSSARRSLSTMRVPSSEPEVMMSASASAAAAAMATTTAATAPYEQSIETFPSLIIGSSSTGSSSTIRPVGTFAEAQAMYLEPDPHDVQELFSALLKAKTGVVAHYYMDVELQGVLQAVSKRFLSESGNTVSRVGIADSLRMGDMAVEMAASGQVERVACLGVDFMSESVQAILNQNGYGHIPVYRASERKIGCSLAESAERDAYRAWLMNESSESNALHVVYINTSLETKAVSNSIVPTITCTSSNVLATLLQASSQIENLKILYGPDTYMGENLETLLSVVLDNNGSGGGWDDEKIARDLHPQHNRDTLQRLRDSISVFPSGNCVVHHMFGSSVVDTVKRNYDDAYVTAHLEVPGEMFEIAMQKSLSDDGVVGSTSDILKFITRKVEDAASPASSQEQQRRLKFILGTEAGMVTSIVQNVQSILEKTGNSSVEAEIVFPVSQDAVMSTDTGANAVNGDTSNNTDLSIVPGAGGGEGCSTAGGCATCPFMKMNDLDALMDVLEMICNGDDATQQRLQRHLPPDRLSGKSINGRPALDLGTEPIAYMRHFMQHKELPQDLVSRVLRQPERKSDDEL